MMLEKHGYWGLRTRCSLLLFCYHVCTVLARRDGSESEVKEQKKTYINCIGQRSGVEKKAKETGGREASLELACVGRI